VPPSPLPCPFFPTRRNFIVFLVSPDSDLILPLPISWPTRSGLIFPVIAFFFRWRAVKFQRSAKTPQLRQPSLSLPTANSSFLHMRKYPPRTGSVSNPPSKFSPLVNPPLSSSMTILLIRSLQYTVSRSYFSFTPLLFF